MEHGLLHELVDSFLALSGAGKRIPKGSTVLLSSVTSLAALGQAGYADKVVAETLRLSEGLSGDMVVVPYPPCLWGDVTSQGLSEVSTMSGCGYDLSPTTRLRMLLLQSSMTSAAQTSQFKLGMISG
jgi:hypothetical protein